jgi:hypothetical protein
MLDLLMQNGFVGDRDRDRDSDIKNKDKDKGTTHGHGQGGQGGQGGTRHVQRFTWRHCWVVHVDFSGVLDKVSSMRLFFRPRRRVERGSGFAARLGRFVYGMDVVCADPTSFCLRNFDLILDLNFDLNLDSELNLNLNLTSPPYRYTTAPPP